MKTIKFLFLLIIFGLLGLLIYQNIDYFAAGSSLSLNLKFDQWIVPELPNWAFWGICFGLGLLITGIKGLVTAFRLGREIKKQEGRIAELTIANRDLKARLDVFIHDPYIRKGLSDTQSPETSAVRPADSDPSQTAASDVGTSDSPDKDDVGTHVSPDQNAAGTFDPEDPNDVATPVPTDQNDVGTPVPSGRNDPGTPVTDEKPNKE
jgi:hypothetical protein